MSVFETVVFETVVFLVQELNRLCLSAEIRLR